MIAWIYEYDDVLVNYVLVTAMTRGEVYKLTWLLSTSVEILGQNQATYVSEDITENITDW